MQPCEQVGHGYPPLRAAALPVCDCVYPHRFASSLIPSCPISFTRPGESHLTQAWTNHLCYTEARLCGGPYAMRAMWDEGALVAETRTTGKGEFELRDLWQGSLGLSPRLQRMLALQRGVEGSKKRISAIGSLSHCITRWPTRSEALEFGT